MKQVLKDGRAFLRSREFRIAVMSCLVVSLMVCTAFASESGGSGSTGVIDAAEITSAFTSGFQTMVVNCMAMVSAMVPMAVSLGGIIFMVGKAMKWFKTMTK